MRTHYSAMMLLMLLVHSHESYDEVVIVLLNVVIQFILRHRCGESLMDYTCNRYCDMLLTTGAPDSQAGTALWEYAQHYSG
jgi:hypothetical protein